MSDSIANLEIGGISKAVKVQADPPRLSQVQPPVVVAEVANRLREAYENGQPWTPDMFLVVPQPAKAPEQSSTDSIGLPEGINSSPAVAPVSSSVIIQAIQLMVDEINERRRLTGATPFGPFEGDRVLATCCRGLSSLWRRFICWVFEVRVGLRHLARQPNAATAMTYVTRNGVLPLRDVVSNMGGSQLAILELCPGQKLALKFRGFAAGFDVSGDAHIGSVAFNLWGKEGWQTPGLRSAAVLVRAKERALLAGRQLEEMPEVEQARVTEACDGVLRRVTGRRHGQGIAEGVFPEARGQRLDLEDDQLIETFLELVRALRAHAVWADTIRQISSVALRSGHSQTALRQNPELAGHDADVLREQFEIARAAETFHKHVGAFTFPAYFLGFSPTTVPGAIDESELVTLATCGERAYPLELLSQRCDRAALVTSKATIRRIEDLTPVVQRCGSVAVDGRLVTDTHRVFRNANGDLLDERGDSTEHLEECMLFLLEGEVEPRVLPIDAWLDQLGYRLTPQVIDSGERRMAPESLQGHEGGMFVALSDRDVKREFAGWRHPTQRL